MKKGVAYVKESGEARLKGEEVEERFSFATPDRSSGLMKFSFFQRLVLRIGLIFTD